MRVPDYISPVVAYRAWQLDANGLRSLSGEQWHPAQVGKMLDSGEYWLEIPYSRPDELIMDIMRHGAEVEVLAPTDLRQAVAARHRAAADIYKEHA